MYQGERVNVTNTNPYKFWNNWSDNMVQIMNNKVHNIKHFVHNCDAGIAMWVYYKLVIINAMKYLCMAILVYCNFIVSVDNLGDL